MANKPQTLCYLTEGKLLSSFSHFVETWNWIVSCVANLKGDGDQAGSRSKESGEGETATTPHGAIKVSGLEQGRPVVSAHGLGDGEGGEVTITGTDGVTVTGNSLVFAAESDSNVTVKAEKDEATGTITVKIGVYWWRG